MDVWCDTHNDIHDVNDLIPFVCVISADADGLPPLPPVGYEVTISGVIYEVVDGPQRVEPIGIKRPAGKV